MNTYTIMTCNLLTDSLYYWGKSAFVRRADAILSMIEEENPDIIGAQEFTDRMEPRLSPLMKTYGFAGKPRSARFFSEYNPVFWRKARFELLEEDTLWLSDSPEDPFSKYFGSQFPRIVTYVILKDIVSGEVISFFNTHLDLYFSAVRGKQVLTLLSLIREKGKGKIILTGDFNENSRGRNIRMISEVLNDVAADSLGSTLRGKAGSTINRQLPIDHIFLSRDIECLKTKKIRRSFNGIHPSDHYPLISEIRF